MEERMRKEIEAKEKVEWRSKFYFMSYLGFL